MHSETHSTHFPSAKQQRLKGRLNFQSAQRQGLKTKARNTFHRCVKSKTLHSPGGDVACDSPAMTGRGSASARGANPMAAPPAALAPPSLLRMASRPVAGFIVFNSALSIPMANKMDPRPAEINE